MTANWKLQKLTFKMGNKTVVITGDASLSRSGITLKAIIKTLKKEGQGYLVEFNHLGVAFTESVEARGASPVPDFLSPVVEHYQNVFNLPNGLPPERH